MWRSKTPTGLKTPLKECILSGEEVAMSLSPIPLATDTLLTLLTRYSKAPKRAAAWEAKLYPGEEAVVTDSEAWIWSNRSGHIFTNKATDFSLQNNKHVLYRNIRSSSHLYRSYVLHQLVGVGRP